MFYPESKLAEAKSLAVSLLDSSLIEIESAKFPETGGVYIFRKSADEVIYVGKAKNLKRRICIDHLSQELKDTMSAFRRSIHNMFGVPFGSEMKAWIYQNYKISFIKIEDPDMRSLVETLLIATVRSKSLLNHDR